ncbi:MAG: glycogen/starch synthase [bacterium]|nr:glycogen/starch synthase [bacterium]
MKKSPFNVLFVGSELAPLAKAGGLGDVLGALPKGIAPHVNKTWVALPFYKSVTKNATSKIEHIANVQVRVNNKVERVSVWRTYIPNSKIPVLLFKNNNYLSRGTAYQGTAVTNPITKRPATAHTGQRLRFLFFSHAVYQFIKQEKLPVTTLHANDYHTAGLQYLLKQDSDLGHIKCLLTIHNMGVVGDTKIELLKLFNWNAKSISVSSELRRKKGIRMLRVAIDNANLINTVSPTYANEILSKEFGSGLENIIKARKKDLSGILNGIDMDKFNPLKDPHIKYKYSIASLNKKKKNKLFLQKKSGLSLNPNIPLFGLVHRLTSQKGLELIIELLPKLLALDAQFVFTGTGDPKYEKTFSDAAAIAPNKFFFHNKFDIPFSQQIYAGSDLFFMPSKYEPCGLSQIIAMRYGSVPIVRATGGLKDTIDDGKNGFLFSSYSASALQRTINRALRIYHNQPKQWEKIMRSGMSADFGWDSSVKKYISLYNKLS